MDTAVQAQDVSPTLSRGTVLLVDDDPMVARGYKRVLAAADFDVHIVTSGADAIAQVKAHDFDVIVSDIMMPGMTGLQLLRAIREHDLDLPVVLMTGAPNVDGAVRALEYGAFNY